MATAASLPLQGHKLTPAQQFVRASNRDWLIAQAYRLQVEQSFEEGDGHEAPVLAWLEQIGYPTTTAAIADAFAWFLAHDLGAWDGPYAIVTSDGGKQQRHWLVIRNSKVYVNGSALTDITYDNNVLTFTGARGPTTTDDTRYAGRLTFSYGPYASLEAAVAAGELTRTCSGRIWSAASEPTTDNARGSSLTVKVSPTKGSPGLRARLGDETAKLDLQKFSGRYTVTAHGKAQGAADFFVAASSLKYGVEFASGDLAALTQASNHLTWGLDTKNVKKDANIRGDLAFSENEEWKTIAGKLTLDGSEPTDQNFFATIVDPEWNKSTETIVGVGAASVVLTIFGTLASYYFYRNAPDVAAAYEAKHAADAGGDKSIWERARDHYKTTKEEVHDFLFGKNIVISNGDEEIPIPGVEVSSEDVREAVAAAAKDAPMIHEDLRQKTAAADNAAHTVSDMKSAEKGKKEAANAAEKLAKDNARDKALQDAAAKAKAEAEDATSKRQESESESDKADVDRHEAEGKEIINTGRGKLEIE